MTPCPSNHGMHSCGLEDHHEGRHACCACEGVVWHSAPREHAPWCRLRHETGHCSMIGAA